MSELLSSIGVTSGAGRLFPREIRDSFSSRRAPLAMLATALNSIYVTGFT
jgi:hypothetical protein